MWKFRKSTHFLLKLNNCLKMWWSYQFYYCFFRLIFCSMKQNFYWSTSCRKHLKFLHFIRFENVFFGFGMFFGFMLTVVWWSVCNYLQLPVNISNWLPYVIVDKIILRKESHNNLLFKLPLRSLLGSLHVAFDCFQLSWANTFTRRDSPVSFIISENNNNNNNLQRIKDSM